jgi:hypothetical protein
MARTIARASTGIERLDADTVKAVMRYFNCGFTDLLQGVEEIE